MFASSAFAAGAYATAPSDTFTLSNVEKVGVASFLTGATPGTHIAKMKELGVRWYYNYQLTPHPTDGSFAADPEFVPMIYNAAKATSENVATAVATGATHLLTFNEPDAVDQANMTVAEALALWPTILEARTAGMLIGSPAVAAEDASLSTWFVDFWAGLAPSDRPDFICLHVYMPSTQRLEQQIQRLFVKIKEAYDTYGLPVWVTEWGLVPFGGVIPTIDQIEQLLVRGTYEMDNDPRIERQSWFSLPYIANSFIDDNYLYDGSWNITQPGLALQRILSEAAVAEEPVVATSAALTDGYSYYEPKQEDIERMLKAWKALEDLENYVPPPPKPEYVRRETVGHVPPPPMARPKQKFHWWDATPAPPPLAKQDKFTWWKN